MHWVLISFRTITECPGSPGYSESSGGTAKHYRHVPRGHRQSIWHAASGNSHCGHRDPNPCTCCRTLLLPYRCAARCHQWDDTLRRPAGITAVSDSLCSGVWCGRTRRPCNARDNSLSWPRDEHHQVIGMATAQPFLHRASHYAYQVRHWPFCARQPSGG